MYEINDVRNVGYWVDESRCNVCVTRAHLSHVTTSLAYLTLTMPTLTLRYIETEYPVSTYIVAYII